MYYITIKGSPHYRQMTFDDYLFGPDSFKTLAAPNETGTVTYEREDISPRFMEHFDLDGFRAAMNCLREETAELRAKPAGSLYREFHIPKKSGGLRKIDAPCDELAAAQRKLKEILEKTEFMPYHTSAFAYVKGRSTVDAVRRHQQNDSAWFGKYDLHDFFGSTTPAFLENMLSMIFPYSVMFERPDDRALMHDCLYLCFKDGGLPQGTPVSPFLTNVMMIPADFRLTAAFREKHMIYTRYADDFLVSSKRGFSFSEAGDLISSVLDSFGAPFHLNEKKTRYGSRAGANWNLGVMLNKDNEITVGHAKKKQLQNMLFAYAMDRKHGVRWDESDIRTLSGYISYYKMVEGDTISRIVNHVCRKTAVDIPAAVKADLAE